MSCFTEFVTLVCKSTYSLNCENLIDLSFSAYFGFYLFPSPSPVPFQVKARVISLCFPTATLSFPFL